MGRMAKNKIEKIKSLPLKPQVMTTQKRTLILQFWTAGASTTAVIILGFILNFMLEGREKIAKLEQAVSTNTSTMSTLTASVETGTKERNAIDRRVVRLEAIMPEDMMKKYFKQ
jgi:hypothetical protein